MRIAHISDIHIRGSVRHDEIRKTTEDFLEQAKSKKIDHILISGDIFHTKTSGITPESIDLLVWFFQELSKVAKVHVTLGNHDGVIHNLDKQDAISPIIKAINNSNVVLYKDSGIYPIADGVELSVYGIFDKPNWSLAQKVDNSNFNIGTFHGPVAGCKTDLDWMLETEASVEYFDMHDVVMLGDIHKQQFLDSRDGVPRMGYPGSFMQNDFGEGIDRHWLLWDIDEQKKTWTVSVENLLNSKPFVTIDSVEDCRIKNGRYKIRTTNELSPADKSKMRKDIKNLLGSSDVVFELEKTSIEEASVDQISVGSLTDSNSIVGYCQNVYPNTNKDVLSIIKESIENASKSELSNGTIWSMDKLEFENVLGYGESNSIDFTGLNGFVGLFGPNKIGKSSLVGAILYSLFNVVDRGTNKSHSIINTNHSSCRAEMTVSTNTEKLQLTRQTIKTKTKNKESSNTQLNLLELNSNKDLTLDQRAATDKVIEKKLGNIDDFRVGSISTQNSIASFLDETPGERRKILSRHIGLDKIEEAYQSVQSEFNVIKSQMKSLSAKLEESNLNQLEEQLSITEKNILELESELDRKSDEHKKFLIENKEKLQIVEKRHSIESEKLKNINALNACSDSIESISKSLASDKQWILDNENKAKDLDAVSKEIVDKEKLNQKLLELWTQAKSIKDSIAKVEKDKKTLSVVPCGDEYPTCPFIKDAYQNVKESTGLEGNLNDLLNQIDEGKKSNSDFEFLKSKRDELIRISSQLPMKQKLIAKSTLDFENLMNQKIEIESKIDSLKNELSKLESPEIETINFDKEISDIKLEISKQNVVKGGLIQKIESFKKSKSEIDRIETKYKNYELAATILSKKGIQTKLLSDNIQFVNNKIKSYLSPHFDFTVEFEIDETNGDAEATIVCDNGNRRSLNLGSGMERTTGCIAIRAAIHSVSVLPKSNFMIIDEGFGSIEGENVTSTINCIKDISKDFKFVLVISHLQTVKDFVDSSITITKNDDGTSRIIYGN